MTKKTKNKQDTREAESDPRQRILDAALLIFAENGLIGARTRDIARGACVNLAMLHYYYRNKEELYIRAVSPLLTRALQTLKEAAECSDDPQLRLEMVIKAYYDLLKNNPAIPRLILWELLTGTHALKSIIGPIVQDDQSSFIQSFWRIFEEGQDRGLFRRHDPDQAILSLISLCVHPFIARDLIMLFRPELCQSPESLELRQNHVFELLMQGLASTTAQQPRPSSQQISIGF